MSKLNLNTAFTGLTKLRDWWTIVKDNFNDTMTGHNALEDRVDNIIAGAGASNTEIVDARHSIVKDKNYTVLTDRLEDMETDALSHKAETAKIYINVFAPPAPLVACKGDGTDDSTAINAMIQYAKSVNGAYIIFPPANYGIGNKIVIDGSNIHLIGFGMGDIHDASGNIAATRFTWIGAASGTMMELCPHITSLTRIDSCEVSNISFIANSLAGYGLVIKSVNNSRFESLYFDEFETSGLFVGVDTAGAIAEACDSQKNTFR